MLVSRPQQPRKTASGTCSSGDAVGDLVRSTGAGAWAKADPGDPPATAAAAGVIVAKPSSTQCVVQLRGEVEGVYSGLTPGRVYWVGSNGRPAAAPPDPTVGDPQVFVQEVGVALGPTRLSLRLEAPRCVRVL